VRHDTSEENMRLLWAYLERFGRPLAFYTDKAGMFQVAVKSKRYEQREGRDRPQMPPTQIARALGELNTVWIPAHSPQAKGRVERQFLTAQDRLVKGLRVAGAHTLGSAPRSATPPEHRNHFMPASRAALSKQDISTLPGIGHFYLTRAQCTFAAHLPGCYTDSSTCPISALAVHNCPPKRFSAINAENHSGR
jgi:hypothetical protein